MPPPNHPAQTAESAPTRRQQVVSGLIAIVQAIPLKVHGAIFWAKGNTVFNKRVLASLEKVLLESKTQLEQLPPAERLAEQNIQFLDISKQLVTLLQSFVDALKNLTLKDLMKFQPTEGDKKEREIDFFIALGGLKFH